MAFLRKETKRGQTYLSICESYRDEAGKVQRRTLHNLGNVSNFSEEAMVRIGRQLIEIVKGKATDPDNIIELSRYNYGFPHVLLQLLSLYGLDMLMKRLKRKHKISFDLLQNLLLMLCDRFNDPLSKLGSYHLQSDYIGLPSIELQHLYRTLDYLAKNNELIQTYIYNKHTDLFNYELDVVFYDVTTFYFDSQVQQPGNVRELGFGKDGKIGKTQILFSLLIDKNKVPIGFQIYKGSTYEGHTMKDAIEKLKRKYKIKRIIVVADSGMLNKNNLALFPHGEDEPEGYEYIVGDRIKNMSEEAIQHLTDLKNYAIVKIKDEQGEEIPLHYCSWQPKDKKGNPTGRTIICTWSAVRAQKDKADREAKILKAEKLLANPSTIDKKAKRHFLKNKGNSNYELDQDKIVAQERFDGFKAIATNTRDLAPETVLEKYKDLYKIEQSFRTFKSYLETRPMFHWTNIRIEGHLVLCYIAFCLLTFLQQRCGYTEAIIRRLLSKMELSKIVKDKQIMWLRSNDSEATKKLLSSIKLKQLPNALSDANIKNYLPAVL